MNRYLAASIFLLVLAGALLYRGGSPLVVIVLLPLFAWFAARAMVHGGSDTWAWFRHRQKEPWTGRYYEFARVHLRVDEFERQLVFFETDLLQVIDQPGSKTVELFGNNERVILPDSGEMALTQVGCERLLLKCPHRDAKKLLLFLQREAFAPYAKRRQYDLR